MRIVNGHPINLVITSKKILCQCLWPLGTAIRFLLRNKCCRCNQYRPDLWRQSSDRREARRHFVQQRPIRWFFNVDLGVGYKFGKYFTVSGQVVNLFDSKVREFIASPVISRLFSVEVKVDLPAYGKK